MLAIKHPEVTSGSIAKLEVFMKIGELAKKVSCSVETIRYYEKVGLLHPAIRNKENNYRLYNQGHLHRLTFVRHCRTLAMNHDEILVLLQARSQPNESCESINKLIDDHIEHVRSRILELEVLEAQLTELRSQCQVPLRSKDCGIIQELDQPADDELNSSRSDSHVDGSH